MMQQINVLVQTTEAHCQFTQTTQVKILASTNMARAFVLFVFLGEILQKN
jgi:hypothetical protein